MERDTVVDRRGMSHVWDVAFCDITGKPPRRSPAPQALTATQRPRATKLSSVGGGGAVSDVAIARFWCFGGDMTETAVTDLVGMV